MSLSGGTTQPISLKTKIIRKHQPKNQYFQVSFLPPKAGACVPAEFLTFADGPQRHTHQERLRCAKIPVYTPDFTKKHLNRLSI